LRAPGQYATDPCENEEHLGCLMMLFGVFFLLINSKKKVVNGNK
jgi:hypothetical protein